MTKLAAAIVARRTGNSWSFTIDGEPFPWHITADGVSVSVDPHGMPSVTLTIPADRVEVLDTLAAAPPDGH